MKKAKLSLKPFFISFILVLAAASVVTLVPMVTHSSEQVLVGTQVEIPPNNSQIPLQKFIFPPTSKNLSPPLVTARSVLIKDLTTDTILYQENATSSLPIASTTKIMTALVASDYFKPNSVLTVNQGAGVSGSRVGLQKGEQLVFRSLLYGMLLNSGNDAAFTIAENYPGGIPAFVGAMNLKSQILGLKSTHFDNPAGFDSANHYSSAEDLSKITEEALKSTDLSRIVATKDTKVQSVDKKQNHSLHNLNQLLSSVTGVLGVKTGYTDVAKENLVGLVERNNHRVLTVVLGSDDRFGETSKLIEWVYSNFIWSD